MTTLYETFSNLAQTTLNGSLDNVTTSVVVVSASAFPTTGNFRIRIDSEIMLVTAVSSNTFTVTRGYESTSAVTHSNGAVVSNVLTAGSLTQFRNDAIGNINNHGQGMYVASHFEQNNQALYIMASTDGISWSLVRPDNVYNPSGLLRDPSLYFDGTNYYVAHTRVNAPFSSFGIATSTDLINWTHVADIDESAVACPGGACALAWAPEWFVDSDGIVHIILALGHTSGTMVLFETHPTTAGVYTSWSSAVQISGSSLPSDMIDPFMIKSGSTYYLWYKNDSNKYYELMTSTSLTSGYTVVGSAHWMSNWSVETGNGYEGFSMAQVDSNTWYAWVEKTDVSDNGLGWYYSVYTGAAGSGWATGSNWSALTATKDPLIKRHGTVLRTTDFITARNVLAGYLSGTRNPSAMVTGSTSVSNSTTTALTYTSSTVHDDVGFFNGSTKMTAPTSGMYQIGSYTHWPSNNIGIRIIEIRINGGTYINGRSDTAANTVNDVRQEVSGTLYLNGGDYVEIAVFQNSGGNLTPSYQNFSMTRLSS